MPRKANNRREPGRRSLCSLKNTNMAKMFFILTSRVFEYFRPSFDCFYSILLFTQIPLVESTKKFNEDNAEHYCFWFLHIKTEDMQN